MPEDLAFPFEWDETADAASVDGDDFYYQHALLLGLIAVYEERGQPMSANDIISLEDRIARIMTASPYFEGPVQINVTEVGDGYMDIEVAASNISTYEITV